MQRKQFANRLNIRPFPANRYSANVSSILVCIIFIILMIPVTSVAKVLPFYAKGINETDYQVETLSKDVSGTGIGFFYGRGYGIYADDNIKVGNLSGNVNGTGVAIGGTWFFGGAGAYSSAYGLYAGSDINIGSLSGKVGATGIAVGLLGTYTSAYGLYAGKNITIDDLSGTVSGTAGTGAIGAFIGVGNADVYGIHAGNNISIRTLSGDVNATGATVGLGVGPILAAGIAYKSAYGLYAGNNIIIDAFRGTASTTGLAVGMGMGMGTGIDAIPVGIGIGGTYVSAYGLYAGKNITINTLMGEISAMGIAGGVSAEFGLSKFNIRAGGTYASVYGIRAGNDIEIDTLNESGKISATGLAGCGIIGIGSKTSMGDIGIGINLSRVYTYGMFANRNINIETFSGNVKSTGIAGIAGIGRANTVDGGDMLGMIINTTGAYASAYGVYAGKDITINKFTGNVSSTGVAVNIGIAERNVDDSVFASGIAISLTGAYASAYGVYAGKDITINKFTGNVSSTGVAGSIGGALGSGFGDFSGTGIGATINGIYVSAYGLYSGNDIRIDTLDLSGKVNSTGMAGVGGIGMAIGGTDPVNYSYFSKDNPGLAVAAGFVRSYGFYAEKNIQMNNLLGEVNGTGIEETGVMLGAGFSSASAYGMYAGRNITIGRLSGNIAGQIASVNAVLLGPAITLASGYGLYAGKDITIGTLDGKVTGSGKAFAGPAGLGSASGYGIYADNNITIGLLSGEVRGDSANYWMRPPWVGNNAYGIWACGTFNGGTVDRPVYITGKVFAEASGDAVAIRSDKAMNIYVTGTLSGKDSSWVSGIKDDGFAIYGGQGDDIVSLDTGATIIGKVDLGEGNNTLNLYGSNSVNNYYANITQLNVGNGTRAAYWTIDAGAGGSTFKNARINEQAILAVNTDITSSIDISKNSILTGNGTITGNVVNNGTLMPYNYANLIGKKNILTIHGNYTHNADAVLMVRANEKGEADRLHVREIATLKGGTVSVLADKGTYAQNFQYTILTANKIDGTFGATETNLAFLNPSVTYDKSNVYLKLTYNGRPYSDAALTQNQKAVAALFDKAVQDKNKLPVMQGLDSTSVFGARQAYDRMNGSINTASAATSFAVMNKYVDVMKNRMQSLSSGTPSFSFSELPVMMRTPSGMGSSIADTLMGVADTNTFFTPTQGFYVKTYGSQDMIRRDDISSRYDTLTSGLVMGFDERVTPSLLLGATIGHSSTRLDMRDLDDTARVKGYQASLYGIYTQGHLYINALLGYGISDHDVRL